MQGHQAQAAIADVITSSVAQHCSAGQPPLPSQQQRGRTRGGLPELRGRVASWRSPSLGGDRHQDIRDAMGASPHRRRLSPYRPAIDTVSVSTSPSSSESEWTSNLTRWAFHPHRRRLSPCRPASLTRWAFHPHRRRRSPCRLKNNAPPAPQGYQAPAGSRKPAASDLCGEEALHFCEVFRRLRQGDHA